MSKEIRIMSDLQTENITKPIPPINKGGFQPGEIIPSQIYDVAQAVVNYARSEQLPLRDGAYIADTEQTGQAFYNLKSTRRLDTALKATIAQRIEELSVEQLAGFQSFTGSTATEALRLAMEYDTGITDEMIRDIANYAKSRARWKAARDIVKAESDPTEKKPLSASATMSRLKEIKKEKGQDMWELLKKTPQDEETTVTPDNQQTQDDVEKHADDLKEFKRRLGLPSKARVAVLATAIIGIPAILAAANAQPAHAEPEGEPQNPASQQLNADQIQALRKPLPLIPYTEKEESSNTAGQIPAMEIPDDMSSFSRQEVPAPTPAPVPVFEGITGSNLDTEANDIRSIKEELRKETKKPDLIKEVHKELEELKEIPAVISGIDFGKEDSPVSFMTNLPAAPGGKAEIIRWKNVQKEMSDIKTREDAVPAFNEGTYFILPGSPAENPVVVMEVHMGYEKRQREIKGIKIPGVFDIIKQTAEDLRREASGSDDPNNPNDRMPIPQIQKKLDELADPANPNRLTVYLNQDGTRVPLKAAAGVYIDHDKLMNGDALKILQKMSEDNPNIRAIIVTCDSWAASRYTLLEALKADNLLGEDANVLTNRLYDPNTPRSEIPSIAEKIDQILKKRFSNVRINDASPIVTNWMYNHFGQLATKDPKAFEKLTVYGGYQRMGTNREDETANTYARIAIGLIPQE